MNLDILNNQGKSVGTIELHEKVFGLKNNKALVHSVLVWYQASRRQGTHSTKTRAEVRGGGKKPWKQKGTGRARAGSIRSPLWNGGGVTFGPKPRDYSFDIPKKARKKAVATVLSQRAKDGKIKVIDALEFSSPKTAGMSKLLKDLKLVGEKVLLVDVPGNKNAALSVRNLSRAAYAASNAINIEDLLWAGSVVITKDALANVEEALKV
ncbi:MAG: 50S ribosomal protein L4 [Candidatus Margulisiibacteriota bacterium]|nr:50S ribosomal protein L4 [Candidatus Margulisiibacteriota bacterium]